jgi:hypothetical protein
MNEQPLMACTDHLVARLAAVPMLQLEALHKAIDASMGFGASVLTWMRDLVQWETARRTSPATDPVLPRATALDIPGAVLTLSVLVAVFQQSAGGSIDVQPTIDLLDAIRQALLLSAGGQTPTLQ